MNPKKMTLMIAGVLLPLTYGATVQAHGYTESPKARQQICVDDGGYWWPDDGSAIPNAACRAAFLKSGTFQFVQNIEFSANVTDYQNHDAVKAVVKDGSLCASGDNAKRGMDVPSADWQKTTVSPDANGEIDFLFYGATPHNPSFWEFYLTRPGFNSATDVLTWADLELIDQKGTLPISQVDGRNMYQTKVKIPAGRAGEAILYTRWQRFDVAGEGFYNCSDIVIDSDSTPPDPWFDKGYYLKQGTEAQAGDEVWFRVFDANGSEKVFEKLAIDASNSSQAIWAEQLARRVATTHSSQVQIGLKNAQGQVEYQSSTPLANKVWLKNQTESYTLDVKKPTTNQPPIVNLPAQYQVTAGQAISLKVTASDPEGQALTYRWNVPSPLQANVTDAATIEIAGYTPAQTTQYSISVDVSDGVNNVAAQTQLTIQVSSGGCNSTDPNAGNYPAWQNGSTYTSGQKVSHQQLVWQANWWNQRSEPSFTNSAWKLLSQVEIAWQANVPYSQNAEVNHNQRRWRAKWWTQSEPGVSSDWQDIGPSTCQ